MSDTRQHTAMATLLAQLKEISANAQRAANDPRKGRELSVLYLDAVMNSLRVAGCDAPELLPLLDLLGGVADIEEGRDSWLNKDVQRATHRKRLDRTRESHLGVACAVVTTFVGEGDTVEAACRYVARELAEKGFAFGRRGSEGKPPWESLRDYRDRLTKTRPSDGKMQVARHAYDESLTLLKTPLCRTVMQGEQVIAIASSREIASQLMRIFR